MQNKSILTAKNLSDIILATTHQALTPQHKNAIKPQEHKKTRQKENTYLIHEITNSLLTARL